MKKLLTLIFALIAMTSTVSAQDAEPDYLCFVVDAGTSISLKKSGTYNYCPKLWYSLDKENWEVFDLKTEITTESDGYVYFKGDNPNGVNYYAKRQSTSTYVYFKVSKPFLCRGNIMTLIDGKGEITKIPKSDCFSYLFTGSPIIKAPKLPATYLTSSCYESMFAFCDKLIEAPELPALTMAYSCYSGMFRGCTSLTQSPELPATTLALCCYCSMFERCTNLSIPPKLPATTMEDQCYYKMFQDCTSLKKAPDLPATKLASLCYWNMFRNCTSLTVAPPLMAKSVITGCYNNMFDGCTNLHTVVINNSFFLNDNANGIWLHKVSETGSCYIPDNETTSRACPSTWKQIHIGDAQFEISTFDDNIMIEGNKDQASIFDEIQFVVNNRSDEGCFLESVYVNGQKIFLSKFRGSFKMIDYESDVTIIANYTCLNRIATDEYSSVDKTMADVNDRINVVFEQRKGYMLSSATYNGKLLVINNYMSSFFMPSEDVKIETFYTPIDYTITTDEYSQVANTTANVDDAINVTFKQRDGYNLTYATYNGKALTVNNYKSLFTMPATNVEIKTQYTKIPYTITTDEYSQVANTTANMGDVVNVTFKQRDGYNLTSATYNGKTLAVNNYKSSFTMPAANVEIKTVYAPIAYAISCSDANITADKTTATIEDKVNLTIKDRTSKGYKLDKVLVNSTEIAVKNFKASFDMKDYMKDVTISAQYSKIPYTITIDEYSQVANTTATVDDAITVTFKQREGFDLALATCNGNPLNIKDYKATFTMPAQDVEIKAVYAEKEYEIAKPSEDVQISQPTAKAGDEINITVTIKDGYTAHLYVNGQEVALNGNLANYIMPSGKIEIKVEYVANPKTPVSEIELDNCAVSVFPNPAKSGEEITLKIGGKFDMNNAKIYLYNASGSLVMQIDNVKEYNQLTLKSGVYVGVLVTNGGKKTFRVAVE